MRVPILGPYSWPPTAYEGSSRGRSRIFSALLALLLAVGLLGCGTIKSNIKQTVVLEKELEQYTYHTSLDTVMRAAKIEFADDWHDVQFDLKNVNDTSFTTNWSVANLDVRTRSRYEVVGTDTPDGCRLTIEQVKEQYYEEDGVWYEEGRHRAYRLELDVVERVEPNRAERIQAKVDSVGTSSQGNGESEGAAAGS